CGDREPILIVVGVIVEVVLADSPACCGLLAVSVFAGWLEWNTGHGRGVRRWHLRRPPGLARNGDVRDRLAGGAELGRWQGPGVRTGIGGIEIDDVAQQHLSVVEFIPPDDNGLEGERALAEPRDHGLAAGLDTLGNSNLALARKEFQRAHFAKI